MGRAVETVVEVDPAAPVSAEELIALAKAAVGSVKSPKVIHIWAELPRSRVGKVLKPDVRAALAAESP